eukprot:4342672-Pleurochrysis_carterae.AAC.1
MHIDLLGYDPMECLKPVGTPWSSTTQDAVLAEFRADNVTRPAICLAFFAWLHLSLKPKRKWQKQKRSKKPSKARGNTADNELTILPVERESKPTAANT